MALHLLNISVDTADPNPEYIAEDLSLNDQESFVEMFIEKVLGFENAIAEYDDPDTQDHDNKQSNKIELVLLYSCRSDSSNLFLKAGKQKYPLYTARLTHRYLQLDPPPPEA